MRWLCLDFGSRRTGVAVSSPESTFALPLAVIQHDASGPSPTEIERLMREHSAEGLVLGLPITMDGTVSAQTQLTLEFAVCLSAYFDARLEAPPGVDLPEIPACAARRHAALDPFPIRIVLWDERLSSWEAQRIAASGDGTRRNRVGKEHPIDAHAAAVILQSYLDANTVAGALSAQPDDVAGDCFG